MWCSAALMPETSQQRLFSLCIIHIDSVHTVEQHPSQRAIRTKVGAGAAGWGRRHLGCEAGSVAGPTHAPAQWAKVPMAATYRLGGLRAQGLLSGSRPIRP